MGHGRKGTHVEIASTYHRLHPIRDVPELCKLRLALHGRPSRLRERCAAMAVAHTVWCPAARAVAPPAARQDRRASRAPPPPCSPLPSAWRIAAQGFASACHDGCRTRRLAGQMMLGSAAAAAAHCKPAACRSCIPCAATMHRHRASHPCMQPCVRHRQRQNPVQQPAWAGSLAWPTGSCCACSWAATAARCGRK